MATVTIARAYLDALLRRAEFHTSSQGFETPNPSNNVTISKTEHDFLLQAVHEYSLLKSALFRGGLSVETLDTLLSSEGAVHDESNAHATHPHPWQATFVRPKPAPITISRPQVADSPPTSDDITVGDGLVQPRKGCRPNNKLHSYGQLDSFDTSEKDEGVQEAICRVPVHDQRTILITNLSDRTTHKDLASIVRGGRILDIFLRNDRSATISFVEGAAEFLLYAKRNDMYLHTKRLEFRWNDRQFSVPPHVANKIANGASRNLVVRGALGKLTADQIRDHLDHIHNLVVVDIFFRGKDAYISTNSLHNALFARTCMMSRTAYKGLRIDWYPDECSAPLPKLTAKPNVFTSSTLIKTTPITNRYTVLDTGSDTEEESEEESYMANGVRVSSQWADSAVA